MLLVDRRVGSGELAPWISQLGVQVEVTDLTYGDFAFLGQGEDGVPVAVGIERKTVTDLVNSTMSGRFAGHQLPGLLKSYQEVWLVIEGIYRPSHLGLLEIPCGKGQWQPVQYGQKQFMYKEFQSLLLTLEVKGGMRVREASGKHETGYLVAALYRWWTDKTMDQHRSHLRFRSLDADAGLLVKPSLCREWAARLPGVAWTKSGKVADYFGSGYAMAQAEEGIWQEIEGIGKTMAKRIVEAIRKSK